MRCSRSAGPAPRLNREARTAEAAAPASRKDFAQDRPSDQARQSSGEQPSLAIAVEVQRFDPPEPLLLAEL